jgi:hypothetical protein
MFRIVMLMPCALLLAACSTQTNTTATPVAAATVGSPPAMTDRATAEAAVRQTVALFGTQLKNVSRLAPSDALRKQLRTSYADLVTPRLLQTWLATPTQAPGRDVSSPWPDSIAIDQLDCADADHCDVTGQVRYVTSAEVANGGTADTRPIHLRVVRTAAGWRIDEARI